MTVELTPELQRFIDEKVAAGGFESPEQAIATAVQLWKEQEELTSTDIEELKRELRVGLEQSQRGESRPLDMSVIRAEIQRRRDSRKTA